MVSGTELLPLLLVKEKDQGPGGESWWAARGEALVMRTLSITKCLIQVP